MESWEGSTGMWWRDASSRREPSIQAWLKVCLDELAWTLSMCTQGGLIASLT